MMAKRRGRSGTERSWKPAQLGPVAKAVAKVVKRHGAEAEWRRGGPHGSVTITRGNGETLLLTLSPTPSRPDHAARLRAMRAERFLTGRGTR